MIKMQHKTKLTTKMPIFYKLITITNSFVLRHKVVSSQALGPGSVLGRSGKRESLVEEECL